MNPGGYLLLGTSESIGDFSDLFESLDRQSKIYKSKPARSDYHYSVGAFFPPPQEHNNSRELPEKGFLKSRLHLRELTEKKLLQDYAPAGVLVNEHGDILYLYGRTGLYLEMPSGEPDYNVLKMARDGLRHTLTAVLSMAVVNKEHVTRPGIRVKSNGSFTTLDLTVRPLEESLDQNLFLITFDTPSSPIPVPQSRESPTDEKELSENQDVEKETIASLKEELKTMEEYLKASNEELQVSNEELKSSNEEMQSMNEELQSTNEELETSREELQSVNEELSTVNSELETKVAELSEANEDMNNLLASTGVGIVFVDNQLHIQRFTPAATKIMNLIPTDVGRPIEHIVTNVLNYDNFITDIKTVLEDLAPVETEVRTREGEWYILRMRPYRTLKNTIEGVVVTFLKQTEALRRLALVVHDSGDAITLLDMDGNIRAWNPMAMKMYGWSETEAMSMNISRLVPEDLKQESVDLLKKLSRTETLKPHRTRRLTKDGRIIDVCLTATPLLDEKGEVYSIMTTERKIKIDL
ncbi:PAS domain-containing protein [Methanolobus chelungpuianus]|uniref:PAS domain-containing protein n=1 Tax=Methanolobus chelungpuianus TaxID=502115 RepID=UPI003182E153